MAIQFNGVNQGLLTSTTSLAQNVAQCSLAAWVNFVDFTTGTGDVGNGIIQINGNGTTVASRINFLALSAGTLHIGGRSPDSGAYQSIVSTATLTSGVWYHVVGMLDFSANIGYIYINGVQSGTTGTLAFTQAITDNTTSYASNLGSNELNTGEFSNASIDDARVYHRLLTDNEIQTIYACRGTDVINYGLQARWLPIGTENEVIGTYGTISVSTTRTASATSTGSTLSSAAYTAPVGSNLVLCVAGTGEGTNSGRVLPTAITFNGNALTLRAEIRNIASNYCGVGLWSKSVTSGESGTITITWAGNNSRRTLVAYTLIGAQDVVEASATAYNGSGAVTTGLTTITDGAMVVTAGAIGDGLTMSAAGTNHTQDATIIASSHAGAIGHVPVATAGTITGIGFSTSPAPGNMEVVLAAFTPAMVEGTIKELSDNQYLGTAKNAPKYTTSFLKYRRQA